MIKVLDVFAGCGGFSQGFIKTNKFEVVAAIEFNKNIAYTYKQNHPFTEVINKNINGIDLDLLKEDLPTIDVIIGGPPCQGFSVAGKRDLKDSRNLLPYKFLECVNVFKPKVFVMENVKGILSFNKGDFFKSLLKEFNSLGYNVQYKICNALDYGLAQARERVFVVGIDKKYKDVVFEFPKENKDVVNTIYNVIGDIEEVGEFEKIGMHNHNIYQNVNSTLYSLLKEGEYLCDVRNGINYVHSWDRDIKGKCSNEEKLILNTILKNRRKKKYGNKDGNPMSLKDIKELVDIENIDIKIQHLVDIGYLQQYIDGKYDIKDRKINIGLKVLDRNTPLTTVTTQMQNIAHYKFPRTLTIRELARIQSFDDDFIFYGNIRNQQIQVGNAVPPLLSYMLANNIFEQFFK